ncbi:NADH-quinone oxidoreductase subunit C [Aeromicrobium sp. 179-A 4D2 NHS]|uniref:NADH-quinone oxidoreductase subunit C n=1 Tax=Aeromicrobium sp. 179-A 4D2 NHS TaxID=3142375 RepID=UPI0039A22BAF
MSDTTQDGSHETRADLLRSDATELEVIEVREGAFGVHGTGDTSGFGGLRRPVVMPGASTPPYGGWFDEVAERIAGGEGLADAIEKVVVHRGEITFFIRRELLLPTARHLRDDPALRFEFFSGVSGVHYPSETGRELHAVYHLLSMTHNRRIRLEVTCPDADPHVPSVVSVYPTADWHERETWDMFGLVFDGHPHLTRILMPDDWQGHPQRKDYPLGGVDVEFKGGFIPAPDSRRSYS